MANQTITEHCDVLVIGGGIAGCFAAIRAKEAGVEKVVQVDKGHVGKSGASAFAAGIIFIYEPGVDDRDDQFRSMVRALGWIAQQDVVSDHFDLVFDTIKEMGDLGVDFVRTPDGGFRRSIGRGKSPLVMFRGPQMMQAMGKAALKRGVTQFNRIMITDLLVQNDEVAGAIGFNTQTGDFYVFKSKATVLATGSTWYKGSLPAAKDTTGDGFAMAYRAGATLSGSELHGAANAFAARYEIGPGMNMYVGQGGRFLNAKGERFMEMYNPGIKDRSGLRLLLPAFAMEVKRGNGPIYLDMTHFTAEQVRLLRETLPLPMKMFERIGLVKEDRFTDLIEWMPTAPLGRLGPMIDRRFSTSLPRLYVCGDAAPSHAHIEGIATAATSGVRAGRAAGEDAKRLTSCPEVNQSQVAKLKERTFKPLQKNQGVEPDQVILSVQEAVTPYDVLLLRREETMKGALQKIEDVRDNQVPLLVAYDPHYLRIAHEASNMVFVAEGHLRSSLLRTESRTYPREDFPYTDNENWLKWIELKRDEGGRIEMQTRDIPNETYPLKIEKGKSLSYQWKMAEKLGIIRIEKEKVVWV